MKLKILILTTAILFLSAKLPLYADWRSYVWTYEYQTMPKGTSEVEFYETVKIPDTNDTDIKTLQHWVEYEYGLTDNFDVGLYQMWKTKDKREEIDTKYDGTKLRFRYRFGKKNQYLLDPLLYVEYKRSSIHHDPHELELKVVFAKDIGNFNIAYNQVLNQALEIDGVTESEYALGLSYKFKDSFSIGIESKGSYLKDQYYIGPTISVMARNFWISLGELSGLNHRSDDIQIRLIAGIPF